MFLEVRKLRPTKHNLVHVHVKSWTVLTRNQVPRRVDTWQDHVWVSKHNLHSNPHSRLLSTSLPFFLITQFLLSFATQNLRIMIDSLILSAASDTDRGEVFGLGASIVGLCRVGGPVVAGSLAELHMMLPLLCSIGFAALGSVLLFWSGTKVKTS